jgi:ABC-type sugar transport system substrate-binding protein
MTNRELTNISRGESVFSFSMRAERFRVCAVALVAVLGSVGLAACGSSSSSSSSNSASTSSTSAASAGGTATSSSASASKSGVGIKVALVDIYNAPYTDEMAAGAKAAAAAVGASFTQTGPPGLNPTTAIADFQNVVASGAKGVLLMAYPAPLWKQPVNHAIAQGVTVATADDYANTSKATFHIGAPKVTMGEDLAKAFAAKLPADAKGTIV